MPPAQPCCSLAVEKLAQEIQETIRNTSTCKLNMDLLQTVEDESNILNRECKTSFKNALSQFHQYQSLQMSLQEAAVVESCYLTKILYRARVYAGMIVF